MSPSRAAESRSAADTGEGDSRTVATRVLLIGMLDSVHVARWVAQFAGCGVAFVLVPSTPHKRMHPVLQALSDDGAFVRVASPLNRWRFIAFGFQRLGIRALGGALLRRWAARRRFDFVHALEFQHAGYLALDAWGDDGPSSPLIATNWGSDIYWFRRFPEHERQIRRLLAVADRYSAECRRDYELARQLGFVGLELPCMPNAGGYDVDRLVARARQTPPSSRRAIVVKGYDAFVGLAPRVIPALELLVDELRDYEIIIYSASPSMIRRAEALRRDAGLDVRAIPAGTMSHEQMLELFVRARLYIGLAQSDGISTSMLDALASGTFPIQTATSCADEWVDDGVSGSLVTDLSPESLAETIRNALLDDDLVDEAARRNLATASERLRSHDVRTRAAVFYSCRSGDAEDRRVARGGSAGV